MNIYKNHDEKFRKTVVNHYLSGKAVEQLSEEYKIGCSTIYSWIKSYRNNSLSLSDNNADKTYIDHLKNEIHQLQIENEILKKALSICIK